MNIIEKKIQVKDYLTKSNLPASDYVINPYIGCPHGCRYCYACFMKRFQKHDEAWGEFIDIKLCDKPINLKKIKGKSVFLSSVTDCYNPYEETYGITRKILEQLVHADCQLSISTKSKLILRDLDLLTQCSDVKVSISINTLDESFRKDMDHASSIKDRIDTLKQLHEHGIDTVLFLSPIFPGITDCKAIMEATHSFVDEYWIENLNLRGSYKQVILTYIEKNYPQLHDLYDSIYRKGNKDYWKQLSMEMDAYCETHAISCTNYLYHEELVKKKKEQGISINS